MGDVRVRPSEWVLGIVTTRTDVAASGAPVFYARDRDELERIALYLARAALASVHEVSPGTLVIMRH